MLFSILSDVYSISCERFLLLFVCGLCFSFAGMLRKADRLPSAVRVLLHYIIDALAAFLFLYLPVSVNQAATRLVMFFLISIIYWLVVGTIELFRSRVRKLMEE